jgi:iron complex outermembrane receptor protein
MARPRMDDLRANAGAGVSVTGTWSGSGGNPALRPWRANSIDVSYERYFSKATYFGAAFFYKKLDSYIYNSTDSSYDFTGVPNVSGITPISNIGNFTHPVNGAGGQLEGIEFSGAVEGKLISPWLNGFGATGSFSRSWTDIHPNGPTDPTRLPGFSGDVASLTLYYENNGFSARISERYRSAFRGEIVQLYATRGYTEILEDKQVDAQFSYDVPFARLKGLTLLLQINNLTDSAYRTRTGSTFSNGSYIPETYETYGRQFLFGFNYKM